MIAEMARKASYENPVSASGVGINGTFTPAKVSAGQLKDLSNGALIGLLDLKVTNQAYDKLRTGKFDLFLKNEKSGLRLYLEEKEKIAAVSGPGSLKHNPPITRWVYGNAVVYFENSHVVSAVLIKSSQLEMGPAPAR